MTRIVRKVRGETIARQSPLVRPRRVPPWLRETPADSFPSEPPSDPRVPIQSEDGASPAGYSADDHRDGSRAVMARKSDATFRNAGSDYEVGYGKPPRRSQFKPGQSGNPKGRPKGSKNQETILLELLDSPRTVRTDKGVKKMSRLEVVLTQIATAAERGNLAAATKLLALDPRRTAPSSEQRLTAAPEVSDADRAILEEFARWITTTPTVAEDDDA